MDKKTIYFICSGNSCRSQMVKVGERKYWVKIGMSILFGIETHGVNPKAIEAMKEVDIDISNHTSDLIDSDILEQSDLVVTLCSDADDNCPILPPNVKKNTGALMIQQEKNGQNFNVLEMKLEKNTRIQRNARLM